MLIKKTGIDSPMRLYYCKLLLLYCLQSSYALLLIAIAS